MTLCVSYSELVYVLLEHFVYVCVYVCVCVCVCVCIVCSVFSTMLEEERETCYIIQIFEQHFPTLASLGLLC